MKILPLFLIIVVLVAFSMSVSFYYVAKLNEHLVFLGDELSKVVILENVRNDFLSQFKHFSNYVESKSSKNINQYLENKKNIKINLEELKKFGESNKKDWLESVSKIESTVNKLDTEAIKIMASVQRGEKEEAIKTLHKEFEAQVDNAYFLIEDSVNNLEKDVLADKENSIRNALFAQVIVAIVGGVTVIFTLIFGLFTGRMITKPLKSLSEAVNKITKGDFTVEIEASGIHEINNLADSIKRAVKTMKLAVLELKLKGKK